MDIDQTPKAQKLEAIQVDPSWDGHFLACCGDPCTARGWGICCLTFWLPCVTHGLNLSYLYTAQKVHRHNSPHFGTSPA